MTEKLDIVNRALAQIRGKRLTNLLGPDNETYWANLFYDETRKALLRAAHWDFSRYTNYLVLQKAAPGTPENTTSTSSTWVEATMPAPPWLYQYAYPSDGLQVWMIVPQLPSGNGQGVVGTPAPYLQGMLYARNMAVPFKAARGTNTASEACRIILTNQPDAIAVYSQDVEDPDLWDDSFTAAMTNALAARLALPVANNKQLWKVLAEQAMSTIHEARARDGNEGTTVDNHTPEWLAARGVNAVTPYGGYSTQWFTPPFLVAP